MTCVAEDGLSVVFSSHVVAELERVATYLVVLSQGRVQVAATVDSLLDSHLALTGPAADATWPARCPSLPHNGPGARPRCWPGPTRRRPAGRPAPVTMEELVLGYLRAPAARVLPRLEAAR